MVLAAVLDAVGVYGMVLEYGIVIAMVGSAALILFHFWRKGALDMDEGPKMQMLEADEYQPLSEQVGNKK